MSNSSIVLDNKKIADFYNFSSIKDKESYSSNREKRFNSIVYRFGGFIVYPLLRNTRLLKIIQSLVSKIFKRALSLVHHDRKKSEKILKKIGIIREFDVKKVTASEDAQKESLKGIAVVANDVQVLYTAFKPSRTQTEPKGDQAGDAKLIKRLDRLAQNVETDFKGKNLKDLKKSTLGAIDTAIVEITKSALGREERAKLFKLCRAGKISKHSREILGNVMYRQYYSTVEVGKGTVWGNSNPTDKEKLDPSTFLEQPKNSLRTKREICEDVIKEIDIELQTETDLEAIKILNNIKTRHQGHLKKLKSKRRQKSEDSTEHSSSSVKDAKNVIACSQLEDELEGKDVREYVKEGMCWNDYNRYLKGEVTLDAVVSEEGQSLYEFFEGLNDASTLTQACSDKGMELKITATQGYQLTPDDIKTIKEQLLKVLFSQYYQSPEYEMLKIKQNGSLTPEYLDDEGLKEACEKYISEQLAPQGWEEWKMKTDQEKKSALEQAEDIVEDLTEVRIPALYHATGSVQAFLSIGNTEVRVLPAIMGTGAFASTVPEIPTYGRWCFAFTEEATAWNSTPVNAFTKSHNAIWAGYSKPFAVPLRNKLGKVVSMQVAYVIVDDDEDLSQEGESDNQQQGLFNQIGISIKNAFNLSNENDHTVKGVRKLLKDNGFRNVTVVSLKEALKERNLIYGKHWCQHPWWEPGYGPSKDSSMSSGPSQHPIIYK